MNHEIVDSENARQSNIQEFIDNLKGADSQVRNSAKIINLSARVGNISKAKTDWKQVQCAIDYAKSLDW